MGEKERGKPDLPQEPELQSSSSTSASSTPPPTSICSVANHTAAPINGSVARPNSNGNPEDPVRPVALGWQMAWRFVYEKWRLCAFIALAVVVSRFSTIGWARLGILFLCQVSFMPLFHFLLPLVHYRCFNKEYYRPLLLHLISATHILNITHQSNSRGPLLSVGYPKSSNLTPFFISFPKF